ncbi:tRNA N(3)-methylcytidine methyltransferase METTL2 [Nematocida homosporus]|uniref:tRNA N(3)-methylcytidine methyltransferase METTL2 n=1 Tax=Nematocida homosporus TaxID=1912981 RepID=UPI00221F0CAF|nr:tRNA N(3)-methylcytidine methyltransferase METTL2 [Nematocida homosporus]KAI5187393.1 tRNA N(3)-methylcytidine methyltransferase METTL2 [Nematocida homosporus]
MRNRLLLDPNDKFSQNAWDDVSLSPEALHKAQQKIKNDEAHLPTTPPTITYEPWHHFYTNHQTAFFKERHWILSEFPMLNTTNQRIFEVGCGTGSTLSQIPTTNHLFGIDCAAAAINIIQNRPNFIPTHFTTHNATLPQPFPQLYTNMDFVLLIFTLSAIHPDHHQTVLHHINRSLKPQGTLLFRDYAEMDLTQLRFKPHQILAPNLYQRGEGTYAYFFTLNYLQTLAQATNFTITHIQEDRRLLINRKKQLEMPRHWIQLQLTKNNPT